MTPVCMLLLNDILKRIHSIPTRLGNRFSITWFTAHNSKNNSRHNMQCLSYFYLSQTNSSETLRCGLDKTSKGVMASSTKMLEADPSGYFCFLIHQHKSPSSFCLSGRAHRLATIMRKYHAVGMTVASDCCILDHFWYIYQALHIRPTKVSHILAETSGE